MKIPDIKTFLMALIAILLGLLFVSNVYQYGDRGNGFYRINKLTGSVQLRDWPKSSWRSISGSR